VPAASASVSISVCCLTRGPTARVAAQLALFRGLASEIVVAVDDSVEPELVGPLADVADVLVRYPYAEPVDRPVGWLHSLCSAEWIFWIDDDEIPSTQLLAELPSLLAEREVTHAFVARRWLFPDRTCFLDEPPWRPDYQLRVVHNDRRVLWFPGVTHWPIEAVGPRRYLEGPIYHTDLLLNPLEARERKVRRYELLRPGQRLTGRPMNDALYLPEERPAAVTAELPADDRLLIDSVLDVESWPEPAAAPELRSATREEIDLHWRGVPVDDSAYRARLEVVERLAPMVAGENRSLDVRVANLGTQHWPWGTLGRPEFRLSYRWYANGELVVGDGLRTSFPEPVAPGASCLVPIDVVAPERPGRHTLELDLVHERVRWFGCPTRVEMEIEPCVRIAIVGADEALLGAAAATMAELLPTVEPVVLAPDPGAAAERIGYPTAASGRSYLLATDRPEGGLRGRLGIVARTGSLLADARRARRRRSPRWLSPAGLAFLEELVRADGLLVVGDDPSAGERESWQHAATCLAAAALGRPVAIVGPPDRRSGGGVLTGVPTRLARARATVHGDLAAAVRQLGHTLGVPVRMGGGGT